MDEFSNEPSIKDRVALDALDAPVLRIEATIANLTPEEVWLAVRESVEGKFAPGAPVRILFARSDDEGLEADTTVRRMVGGSGRMLALSRPETWTSSSRRANSRTPLAIPAYLHPADDGMVVPVRTTNISVGGFHCLTDLAVNVGSEMGVSLMLSPTEPFECRAQVVRIDDFPDDPQLHQILVAFRFVNLRSADDARIAAALAGLGDETDSGAIPASWHGGEGRGSLAP